MSSLKQKLTELLLTYKDEVLLMAKKSLAGILLAGMVLAVAPIAGIAEPTQNSIVVEQEIEQADGAGAKLKAFFKGAGSEVKQLGESIWGEDAKQKRYEEALADRDRQMAVMLDEITKLKNQLSEKTAVSKMSYSRMRTCAADFTAFVETQFIAREEGN